MYKTLGYVAGAAAAALLIPLAACGSEATPTLEPRDSDQPTVAADERGGTPTPTLDTEGLPQPTVAPADLTGRTGGAVGDLAPEFTGITNWINSDPLTMTGLQGKVVLIDFWTYTCINCIRTMPFLREWQDKYADKGLVIVGVHSPEFEFEKDTSNVEQATAGFGLEYAVAQDNDFGTWRAYSNQFWPAKYLVDQEGVVRYRHFGEGAYVETEHQIRGLLAEAGRDLSGIAVNDDPGPVADLRAFSGDFDAPPTRELYGGWDRNNSLRGLYIAHRSYYEGQGIASFYTDPGDHANQVMYLQGFWRSDFEAISHARETDDYEDYIALHFFARSVNAVVDVPEGVAPFEVQVTLEGRPMRANEAGRDVVVEESRSYFRVDEARLYEVVSLPEYDDRELTFSSNSADFALFALTFGTYADVP